MPSRLHGRRILTWLLAAVTLAVVAVGVWARDGGGSTIYGCVGKDGLLYVVTSPDACKKPTTPIEWNTTGPAGPAGPQGAPGLGVLFKDMIFFKDPTGTLPDGPTLTTDPVFYLTFDLPDSWRSPETNRISAVLTATVGVHNLGPVDAYVDCATGNYNDWEWIVRAGDLSTVTFAASSDWEVAAVSCHARPANSETPVTVLLDRVTLTAMQAASIVHVNQRPDVDPKP